MTNAPDDFEQDFSESTVQRPPAAKASMAKNLAAAWQGSPLFKMFVLVVIVGALAAAAIAIFSGNEKDLSPTSVRSAPNLVEAPGTKAPPAYVDAVNDASAKRAEEALQQGKSAFQTPVSGDETKAGLGEAGDESQYDPLAEFRPNTPQEAAPVTGQDNTPIETIDSELLSKMQSQMTSLFDAWRPAGIKTIQVQDPAAARQAVAPTTTTPPNAKIIVASGSIFYGEMLIEANSDAPGPIVAQILSGPFAGGRAIGTFEVTREYLVIRFTKISYKKKDYAADILAVDPNTTLGALVTEKDNRYFTRVILPAAAGFLEGFGSALGTSSNSIVGSGNQTLVVQSRQGVKEGIYSGIGDAASTLGGFFRDEAAATKPLIRVAVGTPMGLFFVNSVTDGTNGGRSPEVIETQIQPQPQQPTPTFSSSGNLINDNNIGNTGVSIIPSSGLANSGVNIIQSPK